MWSMFANSTKCYAQTSYQLLANDHAQITCVAATHHGVLIGTTSGLYQFNGTSIDLLIPIVGDTITALAQGANRTIWVGFSSGSIATYERRSIISSNYKIPLRVKVTSIHADKHLWVGTAGKGVYVWRSSNPTVIDINKGLTDDYVYQITGNSDNNIIVATDRGINTINNNETVVSSFTAKDGLKDNIVKCIAIANGQMLLGTEMAGITVVSNQKAIANYLNNSSINQFLATEQGYYVATPKAVYLFNASSKKIQTIYTKGAQYLLLDQAHNVWAVNTNTITWIANTQFKKIATVQQPTQVKALFANDKAVWYAEQQKLYEVTTTDTTEASTKLLFQLPIHPANLITTFSVDTSGNIWIGTMGNGLYYYNRSSKSVQAYTLSVLPKNAAILSLRLADNALWISSLEGIYKLLLANPVTASSLNHDTCIGGNYVYDIYASKHQQLWFATDGNGIVQRTATTCKPYQVVAQQPLGVVYKIAADKHDALWFTTQRNGILQYQQQQWRNYYFNKQPYRNQATSIAASKGFVAMLHEQGLQWIDVQRKQWYNINKGDLFSYVNTELHALATYNGHFWFVTDNGLIQFTPKPQRNLSIEIANIQLMLADTVLQNGVQLPYNENTISFTCNVTNFLQGSDIRYRYQLEGLSSGWTYTNDNTLQFSKLPAGSYQLIWQASANEFIDTPATTTFSFTVRLPFWKTWWFVFLAMATSIAIVYGFIRWRILQVKRYAQLEQEKIQARFDTLRNQINPHFLFNSFNALMGEIEDDPKAAVAYVQHLSLFFRNMVSYRDKEWITLQEELHILEHYQVLQQRRYGNALLFHIQINATTATQYLIAPLVLQMLAENAIKHNAVSSDTPLTVNITATKTHVIVANNINKRITPAEGTGMGLQNIQKRYLLLTGKQVTIKHTDQIFEVAIPLVTT